MRKTVADYSKLVAQWHSVKNGNLKPVDFSYGSNKNVWWKCSVADDHEWQAPINRRTFNNAGCPCCAGKKIVASNCLDTIRPDIAAQWHCEKNGDLTPKEVSVNSGKKVWWKCPVADDHEWQARIINRVNGTGCLCCINQKTVLSNCLATTNPNVASQWHPVKNSLKPTDVCAGSDKKIWWICSIGHEWRTEVWRRTTSYSSGCSICNESKGEKRVAEYLDAIGIKYKRQWKFSSCRNILPLPFDFVVRNNKKISIIEYQGKQHYGLFSFGSHEDPIKILQDIKKRDAIKRKWCKDKDVPFLEIPYTQYESIEFVLTNFLSRVEQAKIGNRYESC